MPRLRGYRTRTRGAPSDVPQQSTCHQITAVWGASHPTSGAVASTPLFIHIFIYIYIGVVGEKLRTHTTPLRLLRRRLGLFALPRFSSLLPPILRCCSSFLRRSRIRSSPPPQKLTARPDFASFPPNGRSSLA